MKRLSLVPILFALLALTPVYWLLTMSLKTNAEIAGALTLCPTRRRCSTMPSSLPMATGSGGI